MIETLGWNHDRSTSLCMILGNFDEGPRTFVFLPESEKVFHNLVLSA